jgi:hypothetical protein
MKNPIFKINFWVVLSLCFFVLSIIAAAVKLPCFFNCFKGIIIQEVEPPPPDGPMLRRAFVCPENSIKEGCQDFEIERVNLLSGNKTHYRIGDYIVVVPGFFNEPSVVQGGEIELFLQEHSIATILVVIGLFFLCIPHLPVYLWKVRKGSSSYSMKIVIELLSLILLFFIITTALYFSIRAAGPSESKRDHLLSICEKRRSEDKKAGWHALDFRTRGVFIETLEFSDMGKYLDWQGPNTSRYFDSAPHVITIRAGKNRFSLLGFSITPTCGCNPSFSDKSVSFNLHGDLSGVNILSVSLHEQDALIRYDRFGVEYDQERFLSKTHEFWSVKAQTNFVYVFRLFYEDVVNNKWGQWPDNFIPFPSLNDPAFTEIVQKERTSSISGVR